MKYTKIADQNKEHVLTMTTLARWAETSAYTPPEEPTTGAVMSVTDTASEPGTSGKNMGQRSHSLNMFALRRTQNHAIITHKGCILPKSYEIDFREKNLFYF
jgi:hypothetical protein